MKILEVGSTFRNTEKETFKSRRRFLDFDMLILSFEAILADQRQNDKQIFYQRRLDLDEYLQYRQIPLVLSIIHEHNIIVTTPTGQPLKVGNLLPVPQFEIKMESGTQMEIVKKTAFTDFFTKYEQHFHYTCYFSDYSGTPTLLAPFTKKVIAFYNERSIFLPPFKLGLAGKEAEFLAELYVIAQTINKASSFPALPPWSSHYFLPEEKQAVHSITEISSQISDLQNKLVEQENFLSGLQEFKQVLTTNGPVLEEVVKKIFTALGFSHQVTGHHREDLIMHYEDRVAVVEIKGLGGSAAERNSSQLEKWVSSYFTDHDKHPKGILVVNAYKDLELIKRSGDAFPHQMLKYATQREHCLITTTQLLGIYFKRNTSEVKSYIQDLFTTVGIYPHFKEWNTFIEHVTEENS